MLWPTSAKQAPVTRPTYPEPIIDRSMCKVIPTKWRECYPNSTVPRSILSRAARIEIQIKPEFRKRLQGKSKKDTVFFYPTIVAHDRADGSDPAGEIAIDCVSLLLEHTSRCFVLFLHRYSPVIVNPVIPAHREQTAVNEKWILVQVAVAEINLQVRHRLHRYGGIDFGKSFIKGGNLGINCERGPR